jgi:hypothetical protein
MAWTAHGIRDAVAAAGPQASITHTEADIAAYLGAAGEFLDEVLS